MSLLRRQPRPGERLRLGVVWTSNSAANYRAIDPMNAMARRGHTVIWPNDSDGDPVLSRLVGCDVVHVYRRSDEPTMRIVQELASRGVAITWDNDDDFTAIPKGIEQYRQYGALSGQRSFSRFLKMARLAYAVTTPSPVIAEVFKRGGIDNVEVIPNALCWRVERPRVRHDGVVVGWVAGGEHKVDVDQVPIVDALRELVRRHRDVLVCSIGLDLKLPEGYRHVKEVNFHELPRSIGGFDIGIAPLTDIPFNRARSDIKLKEYAASEVAWLASPVGPYAAYGESEGGRLVADSEWLDALARLVTRERDRRRLARKAKAWAKGQTIEATAGRWEQLFLDAAAARPGSGRQPLLAV